MRIDVYLKITRAAEGKLALSADVGTRHIRETERYRGQNANSFLGGTTVCAFNPHNYPHRDPIIEISRCHANEDGYNRRLGRLTCIERFINHPTILSMILPKDDVDPSGTNRFLYVSGVGYDENKALRIIVNWNWLCNAEESFTRLKDLATQSKRGMAVYPRPEKPKQIYRPVAVIVDGAPQLKWSPL